MTTALTLPQRAAIALGTAEHELKLVELVKASANILTVTNLDGRTEAHRAAMNLRNARTEITKTGKAAREDATAFSKAVIAEEARLIAIIEPEEERVFGLRDTFDAEEKARKDALIAAERARVDAIKNEIANIQSAPVRHIGSGTETLEKATAFYLAIPIEESKYAEFTAEAEQARLQTLAKLRAMFDVALAAEAEALRQQQEREADEARAKQEREELAAAQAKLKADQDAAAAELKRQRDLIEAERKETMRIAKEAADEMARLAKVEADRVAEIRRVEDEQRAEAAAEHQRQMDEQTKELNRKQNEADEAQRQLEVGLASAQQREDARQAELAGAVLVHRAAAIDPSERGHFGFKADPLPWPTHTMSGHEIESIVCNVVTLKEALDEPLLAPEYQPTAHAICVVLSDHYGEDLPTIAKWLRSMNFGDIL